MPARRSCCRKLAAPRAAQFILVLIAVCYSPSFKCSNNESRRKDEGKLKPGEARCQIIVQGQTDDCEVKGDFGVCQADVLCESGDDEPVRIEIHPALSDFTYKFEGVVYETVEDAKRLIKLLSPKRITLSASSFNNLVFSAPLASKDRRSDTGSSGSSSMQAILAARSEGMKLALFQTGFFNNSGHYDSPLNLRQSQAELVESTFVGNNPLLAGAITLEDGAKVEANASTFEGNGLDGRDGAPMSGAFYVSGGSDLEITSSKVSNNVGSQAGAIVLVDGSTTRVTMADIANNKAVPADSASSDHGEDGDSDVDGLDVGAGLTAGAIVAIDSDVELVDMPLNSNSGPHAGALLASGASRVSLLGTRVYGNGGGGDDGLGALALLPSRNDTSGVTASSSDGGEDGAGEEGDDDDEEESDRSSNGPVLVLSKVNFAQNEEGRDCTCGGPGDVQAAELEGKVNEGGWISGEATCEG